MLGACLLEWRINHVVIVLSFSTATTSCVQKVRDSDLDNEAEATKFLHRFFYRVELYIYNDVKKYFFFNDVLINRQYLFIYLINAFKSG